MPPESLMASRYARVGGASGSSEREVAHLHCSLLTCNNFGKRTKGHAQCAGGSLGEQSPLRGQSSLPGQTSLQGQSSLQSGALPASRGSGPRIYVGGIPTAVSETMIRQHFSQWGQVGAKLPLNLIPVPPKI